MHANRAASLGGVNQGSCIGGSVCSRQASETTQSRRSPQGKFAGFAGQVSPWSPSVLHDGGRGLFTGSLYSSLSPLLEIEQMPQQPSSVGDCMHRNPLTIRPEASLVEAIETIVENRLTGLTVTDADGRVCGVISELDCLRGVLASIYNDGDPERSRVEDVMTSLVNSCSVTDSIVEVAQSMLDTRQRRRPV